MTEKTAKAPLQLFMKLINNDIVFGNVTNESDGQELRIDEPYTIDRGNIMTYLGEHIPEPLKFIQIHISNVLWAVPLTDLEQIHKFYNNKDLPDDSAKELPEIVTGNSEPLIIK